MTRWRTIIFVILTVSCLAVVAHSYLNAMTKRPTEVALKTILDRFIDQNRLDKQAKDDLDFEVACILSHEQNTGESLIITLCALLGSSFVFAVLAIRGYLFDYKLTAAPPPP